MTERIKLSLSKLPTTSGVYFFLGENGKKLYIGKATNLKSRVRSYFATNIGDKRSPLIGKMVLEAKDIKFERTDSVLEALILESALIKKFEPPYNTAEKDQKSWNWVVITQEDFPRVLVVRERELKIENSKLKIKSAYGPYTNGSQLREALKIVRKIFPFRDKCTPRPHPSLPSPKSGEGRAGCFNYQIGLCPGVCAGAISKQGYNRIIRHIQLFFQGKKKDLVRQMTREMKMFAKARDFENADKTKKQIFALEHINDISLIKYSKLVTRDSSFRIEAYDVAHTSGKDMVGVMVVVEDGKPNKQEYRMFKIRHQSQADDTRALREVLTRRLKHSEWRLPDLIVVDGGVAQLNTASETLKDLKIETRPPMRRGLKDKEEEIVIVAVTKDERHRPKNILALSPKLQALSSSILLANSEAHRFAISFHKRVRSKSFLYPQSR